MDIEWWKYIPGYEGLYMASDRGRIRSCDRYCKWNGTYRVFKGQILKPYLNKDTQYLYVDLRNNNNRKMCSVHRLVALTWISNPDNLPQVDHINTIRTDNRIENLRWVDSKGQMSNSITKQNCSKSHQGKKQSDETIEKKSKKINQLTLDGKLVKVWSSQKTIQNELGFLQGNISNCCTGRLKSYKGYIWQYA